MRFIRISGAEAQDNGTVVTSTRDSALRPGAFSCYSALLASSGLERRATEEELVCVAVGKDGQMDTEWRRWKLW